MKQFKGKSVYQPRALLLGVDREYTLNIAVEKGLPDQLAFPGIFCLYDEDGNLNQSELKSYLSRFKYGYSYFVKVRQRYLPHLTEEVKWAHASGHIGNDLVELVKVHICLTFGRRGFANYFDTALVVLPGADPLFLWKSTPPGYHDPLLPPPLNR